MANPPLKIAYLWDRLLPTSGTDAEQALSTMTALSRRGNELRLLIPRPLLTNGLTAADLLATYQVSGTLSVEHLGTPCASLLPWRKVWFALRAPSASRHWPADLWYTRNSLTFLALASSGVPVVYDTHRAWTKQLPWTRALFRHAMNRPNVLAVLTHSEYTRRSYLDIGVREEVLHTMLNGFDPGRFRSSLELEQARAELGLPRERPLVVYTGHISALKGLDTVIDLARRVPEADFLLVGSEGNGIVEHRARQLGNMRVLPWQPYHLAARYMAAATVLLLPPSSVPLKVAGHTVLPMKVYGYLAAGRPILGPDTPDVAEVLTHDRNAVLVPAGDIAAAERGLRRLISDSVFAAGLANEARASSTHLTWDARAGRIENVLRARLAQLRAISSSVILPE